MCQKSKITHQRERYPKQSNTFVNVWGRLREDDEDEDEDDDDDEEEEEEEEDDDDDDDDDDEEMEFSTCSTVAVYLTYFESLTVYRNTRIEQVVCMHIYIYITAKN